MNSKLLLVVLFAALIGTTWLLVRLVSLPPMGDAPAARDTSAVADRKAVVNPFAPQATDGVPDSVAVDPDSVAVDSVAAFPAAADSMAGEAASEGARP
ncbi:MAG: hypothetical protein AAGG50_05330 [Bacteroidota bacterium]